MRLDTEAIAGLPCLEEALDCFRDAGLLNFMTDKDHWNEELLLQFYATLHIRGYSRDPKTWVLEWMTGNVHHEAKDFDLIELTGLPTPGELYEPGCQRHCEALESIFHKPKPNMRQMLSMMKPLPLNAEYPKEFFVEDLEYLPRTIYHIIRRTLWPVKGHSSSAKLEGTMKTLVFYIFNGISFNAQHFFIRQLAMFGSDLFGLKFYAPWIVHLIKLHSAITYQPSARNHHIFLPEVDMSAEAIYQEPAKEPVSLHNANHQSFTQQIERVPAVSRIYPLAGRTRLPRHAETEATESTITQ